MEGALCSSRLLSTACFMLLELQLLCVSADVFCSAACSCLFPSKVCLASTWPVKWPVTGVLGGCRGLGDTVQPVYMRHVQVVWPFCPASKCAKVQAASPSLTSTRPHLYVGSDITAG